MLQKPGKHTRDRKNLTRDETYFTCYKPVSREMNSISRELKSKTHEKPNPSLVKRLQNLANEFHFTRDKKILAIDELHRMGDKKNHMRVFFSNAAKNKFF
jgi:hypothetical protein